MSGLTDDTRPHREGKDESLSAAEIYSPEPNILERRFARYLTQKGADRSRSGQPSEARARAIRHVTRWTIGLASLAGILSGGLIGGSEIWVRQGLLDGAEDAGWRETLPYWSAYFAFAGVVSLIEIAFLYALALEGIGRLTRHAGLDMGRENARGLFAHGLARTALEFPSPQIRVYGIDPYRHVSKWKLLVLNIAYKLKVGASSFIMRVLLRRVAARMAIRGMVPLAAGPLYAVWNAYIIWRIMTEARIRALAPFVADALIDARFQDGTDLCILEKDMCIHAAGEMMARGRDAHPNHIYLIGRLRKVLDHDTEITPEISTLRDHLPELGAASQARVLDLLTVSCVIGASIHREQMALLRICCQDSGMILHQDRVKALRKAMKRGHSVSAKDISATRSAKND